MWRGAKRSRNCSNRVVRRQASLSGQRPSIRAGTLRSLCLHNQTKDALDYRLSATAWLLRAYAVTRSQLMQGSIVKTGLSSGGFRNLSNLDDILHWPEPSSHSAVQEEDSCCQLVGIVLHPNGAKGSLANEHCMQN